MTHNYTKVTKGLPKKDKEVWSYNGETVIKNKHDGERWLYEMKYPTTHWKYMDNTPSLDEVRQVREELATVP